jgi:D-alanyl-D-alanine carboxypeptidase (penicillin-binding protein 5/6)
MFIYYKDKDHFMSTEDLVISVKRIFTDFPEYYNLFSEQCLTYGDIVQKKYKFSTFAEFRCATTISP